MRPPGVLDLAPGVIAGYLPIVLVVVLVLGAGLFAIRSRSLPRSEAVRTTGLEVALGLWLALTLMLTIVPFGQALPAEPVAVIPFLDVIRRVADGASSVPHEAVDIVLNVVAFVPPGVIAALRWGRRRRTLAIVVAAALSIGIELAQALEGLGRSPSATDVVTNTAGAALGFAVGLRIHGRLEA
jgi:glycopeptide antibiotics resistance protein